MIKILFISHSAQFGGAEKMLLEIMRGVSELGIECHCVFPNAGPIEAAAKSLEFKTYICRLKWCVEVNYKPLLHFHAGLEDRVDAIRNIIISNDIDLVVTNTIVIMEGALAARTVGVPHVWRIAELLSLDPSLKSILPLKYFYSIILSLSDKIIVSSEAIKKEILDFIGKSSVSKIEVIYNSFLPRQNRRGLRKNKNKIVFSAGHICPRKGSLVYLKSAYLVHKKIPDVKFLLAGRIIDYKYYQELLKLRKKLKMTKIFQLCGFQEDIYPFLKQSQVFVLSSLSEPFGVVLLEAMSMGVPIVATDSGGPAEVVINDETGFLVPVNDDRTMAERVIHLLQNSDYACRMGETGRRRLTEVFTPSKMSDQYIAVFREAISQHSKKNNATTLSVGDLVNVISAIQIGDGQLEEIVNFTNYVRNSLIYKIFSKTKRILNFKLTR